MDESVDAGAWEDAHERTSQMTEQAAFEDMERHYVKLRQERDRLQLELQATQDKLAATHREHVSEHDRERQIAQLQHEESLGREKIRALEEEKQLGQERLDRLQMEADSLRGEIRSVCGANAV
jgi:predicted  nucleic acid-binding Zn-ribbon protein